MIWHEGYHHGQIKLALKLAGHPITDDEAGPVTWSVWMNKNIEVSRLGASERRSIKKSLRPRRRIPVTRCRT